MGSFRSMSRLTTISAGGSPTFSGVLIILLDYGIVLSS